jgi:uncharacterized delta-60 repeat protein
MGFEVILENTSTETQKIDLLSATSNNNQSNKRRFTLPYATLYPSNTNFRILIGSINHSITITENITLTGLISLFNERTFSDWSIHASTLADGNVIDCISVDGATQLEITYSVDPPVFVSATTTVDGTKIEITFDKSMSDPTGKEDLFSYSIDGSSKTFNATALKGGDDTTIVLDCDTTIEEGQTILVNYSAGNITSTDDGYLGSFAGESVTNVVVGGFTIGTGFNGDVYSNITIQSDNKILVGGDFTSYNGNGYNRIIRLNPGGSRDTSFSIGTGFNDIVRNIGITSDGKIVVVGDFTQYNGNNYNGIIRLNSDGSIDTGFSIGTGFAGGSAYKVKIQPDNKIIAIGAFTSYNGSGYNRIIRIETDGSIDAGFTVGTGFNVSLSDGSLTIQDDGKILVVGNFTEYDGSSYPRIIRLDTDGSIDAGFTVGTGLDFIARDVCIRSDGRIVVVGDFTTYNTITFSLTTLILNADGTEYTVNLFGTGFFGEIPYHVEIQTDDKIIVAGSFTSYNGTNSNNLVRINTDLSFDASFNIGAIGLNNASNSIKILSTGKVLVAGTFTEYKGNSRNRIIQLNDDGTDNTNL